MDSGKLAGEVSRKRHHPLAMDVACEFRFALNVDHPFGADGGACGNPRWAAEGVIAELMYGEPIDLAHDFLVQIHHQGAFSDLVLDPLLRQIRPMALVRHRSFDIRACDERMTLLLLPLAGFPDEV